MKINRKNHPKRTYIQLTYLILCISFSAITAHAHVVADGDTTPNSKLIIAQQVLHKAEQLNAEIEILYEQEQ